MKKWMIRSIIEDDAKTFATKLQNTLNRMERLGYTFEMELTSLADSLAKGTYVAMVRGHGDSTVVTDEPENDNEEMPPTPMPIFNVVQDTGVIARI